MTSLRDEHARNVNPDLTLKRRRKVVENDEYAAFLRRAIRAFGHRIAAGDIDALYDAASLSAQLDITIKTAITGLRARGYSWADIGLQLGVTKQAAQQRWGEPERKRYPMHDRDPQSSITDECERRYHDQCPPVLCDCYCHLDETGEAGEVG